MYYGMIKEKINLKKMPQTIGKKRELISYNNKFYLRRNARKIKGDRKL